MKEVENITSQIFDLIEQQDFSAAKILIEKAITLDCENIELYKNLGLCEINLDNPIAARNAFLKVLDKDPSDAVSIFYLANCYNKTGDKDNAIEHLKKVIELRPDYLEAYKTLAVIYIEILDTKSAIEIAQKAIENPQIESDYSIYYILATAYMLNKDNQNSAKYLEIALSLNKTNVSISNSLAVIYINTDNDEKALSLLNETLELDEKNALTLYNLGVYWEKQEEFKKAFEYYKKAYNIEPSIAMLAGMASCSKKSEDYVTAQNLYGNLVFAYPNNIQYRLSYIEALEANSQYSQALENINLLLMFDSKDVDLLKKKGACLRKLGLYQESIDVFKILINRGKIDVEVYYNMAFNFVELQELDNACEMFKKCIILEPNNPYAHKDLGVLYLKMNCYEWALDEMQKAISLEPNIAEFHYSCGVCYMSLSQMQKAKECLEHALKLNPDYADCLAYYGYIFMLEKNNDKAMELLQKAISKDSNNFLAKTNLAKLYFSIEKYETAKDFLCDILEKNKDHETMNMLGISYMKLEKYNEAAGIFSKLVIAFPKNHVLLTNLAYCEEKCNKNDEALEHLRRALFEFEDYPEALNVLKELQKKKNK